MIDFHHNQPEANTNKDLGNQGVWPTHPKLLDWLAVDFREKKWDIKHLVKLIVTSKTYKQSAIASDSLREKDPYNYLYARQSQRRLVAESVRDNSLVVSGLFNPTIGGPSVFPYQPIDYWSQLNFPRRTYQQSNDGNQYRRGLYTHVQRTFMHPSLLAFDAGSRQLCLAQRGKSNTPVQALVLLNDPTYVEAANAFAQRIMSEAKGNADAKIKWAFKKALSRSVNADELKLFKDFYYKKLAEFKANPQAAEEVFTAGLFKPAGNHDKAELAAWAQISRSIFNLHEFISRN